MTAKQIERALRSLAWAEPAAGLRERVLSGVPSVPRAITLTDRIWFSRAWRLAGIAAVLILAALESISAPARPAIPAASPQTIAEARVIEETAQQAGLSREQAAALARRAVAAEKSVRPGASFGGLALEDLNPGGEPR